MRKSATLVSDQVRHKAVQPQRQARGLYFHILEEYGLHYLCSKTKTLISCAVIVTVVLRHCFGRYTLRKLAHTINRDFLSFKN